MTPAQTLMVLVAALVFGVIGMLAGQRKGHPVWGFSMGFFLSVIGIAIVALSRASGNPPRDAGDEERPGPLAAWRQVRSETERL